MKFKKLAADVILPEKGYATDAGYDLFARQHLRLEPGQKSPRLSLEIACDIPVGFYGEVKERSSQGKKGIVTLGNIVDPSYTGPIHVTLVNLGDEVYEVARDEKICQIIFMPFLVGVAEEVQEIEVKERGDNAHGSTGNTAKNGKGSDGVRIPVVRRK